MHEAHGRGSGDLGKAEEPVGPAPVHVPADEGDDLTYHPAGAEAQHQAQHKAVKDLDPLGPVDASGAVLDGDGRSRKTGDEAVALAGGDPENGRPHAVYDNGEQGRAEGDQRVLGAVSEVHHIADGGGHGAVDLGHDEHAQEIKKGAHDDGVSGA